MPGKDFMNISKEECVVAYRHLVENSEKKWEGSLLLARANDFGGATSYAIISIEELIKAVVISLDGNGFSFREVKGMKVIFKNHYIRYLIAYAIFVINIFGEDLVTFLKHFRNNPEGLMLFMKDITSNNPELIKKMNRYVIKKVIAIRKEFAWFKQLDVFRQDGFYVDYQEQVRTPIDISKENFESLQFRLEKVRSLSKVLIDGLWSEDEIYRKPFLMINENMIEKGGYQQLAEGLKKLKETRENPFDVMARLFKKDSA